MPKQPNGYKRLNPTPFRDRIGLSTTGALIRKCECGHRWVKLDSTGKLIIWNCEKCGAPRLARRKKSDQELISELLIHPQLRGWDGTFARAMTQVKSLGNAQRIKLQNIAEKLEIDLEINCSLSEAEGVGT